MSFTDWEVSQRLVLHARRKKRKNHAACVLVICCLTTNVCHSGYALSMNLKSTTAKGFCFHYYSLMKCSWGSYAWPGLTVKEMMFSFLYSSRMPSWPWAWWTPFPENSIKYQDPLCCQRRHRETTYAVYTWVPWGNVHTLLLFYYFYCHCSRCVCKPKPLKSLNYPAIWIKKYKGLLFDH